jgi:hypothetical protein
MRSNRLLGRASVLLLARFVRSLLLGDAFANVPLVA